MIQLRDYQEEAVNALFAYFEAHDGNPLLVLPTGCHARGTRVVMIDGSTKAVEEICAGDQLIGPDSTPRNVLSVITGTEPMHRLTPHRGGASFVVNENHVLSLLTTNEGKPFPSSTRCGGREHITVKDYLAKSKSWKHLRKLHRSGCVQFSKRDEPVFDPWALGALLGDGSLMYGVSFVNPDHDVLNAMLEVMRSHGLEFSEKTYSRTKNIDCWHVRFVNAEGRNGHVANRVTELLKKAGVFGLSSEQKFVPEDYKLGSVETRVNTLSGLLDTDGHLNKGSGYDFISKSRRLSEDVVFLSRSLGMTAVISECQKYCQTGGGGTYWRVSISGDLSWLPMRCQRKKASIRRQVKNPLVTGFKIEPVGEGEFFGFTLDGDHLYLTDDFMVHHNSGKSVVQAAFIERMERLYPGQRVLLLTHVKELIEQNYLKFNVLLPNAPCGIHSASLGRKDIGQRFLFGGIQSIWRKAEKIGTYDLIMIDEAHLVPAKGLGMYRCFLDDMQVVNPMVKIIGLTATPFRLDSGLLTHGEGRIFTDIAYDLPLLRLVDAGHLAPVISRGSLHHADLSGVHKRGGEFVEQEAAEAMMSITGSALDEVITLAVDRRSWLLFATNVNHANQINAVLRRSGITSDIVTGDTPKIARSRIIEDFKRGTLRALVNVMVLTTGFDAPKTDCLVSMRPTLSAGLWLQMCGRGMRTAEGKENCLVLDYAGNIARHGPLDMIRGWAKKQSEEPGEAPTKKCEKCGTVCHAALAICPNCGYEFPPPEMKIEGNSSSEALLSSQYSDTTDYPVTGIEYEEHISYKSGSSTLRVDYHCGLIRFSEYVCLEHQGYARGKAIAWWVRMGGMLPAPLSVQEAEARAEELRRPITITVKRVGKYPEIVGHRFGDMEEVSQSAEEKRPASLGGKKQ